MDHKLAIKKYFQSWIDKESSVMDEFFADDILYIECYGPMYKGKAQCMQWFKDWNQLGSVLKWDIKNIYQQDDIYSVEWYFECDFENNVDGFDGVSLVEFKEGKIQSIKEFQSKSQHHYPYGDEN